MSQVFQGKHGKSEGKLVKENDPVIEHSRTIWKQLKRKSCTFLELSKNYERWPFQIFAGYEKQKPCPGFVPTCILLRLKAH